MIVFRPGGPADLRHWADRVGATSEPGAVHWSDARSSVRAEGVDPSPDREPEDRAARESLVQGRSALPLSWNRDEAPDRLLAALPDATVVDHGDGGVALLGTLRGGPTTRWERMPRPPR
jgi:hypothetical protein